MIRSAGAADVQAIADLEQDTFGAGAWNASQIAADVEAPLRSVMVAEVDGRVVGYAVVAMADDVADLMRIAVAEPNRRSGIASDVLAALHDMARQAGAERILLEVAESNVDARAFYAAHGYTEISRRPAYYADRGDALVLMRALG
jgi:ribosomal-protein-alanine acetyltransferase